MNTNPSGGESGGGGVPSRQELYLAAIDCGHSISDAIIVLHCDEKQAGHNALAQLGDRLDACATQLLAENQRLRELLREVTEAFTVRYPSAEQGQAAQTAWVMRQSKAVESARAALSKDQA